MLLFLQNIRLLGLNYNDLLATFEANQIMPLLVALTETWLKDYSNNQLFCNKNLQLLLCATDQKQGDGGVALLASKEYQLSTIRLLQSIIYKF